VCSAAKGDPTLGDYAPASLNNLADDATLEGSMMNPTSWHVRQDSWLGKWIRASCGVLSAPWMASSLLASRDSRVGQLAVFVAARPILW
jgi:hypothetical protein